MTAVIVAALVAFTPPGVATQPSSTSLYGGGGPDEYGYRYLDSDTICEGAPTYNWIEIKGVGTQVTGIGDDNVVGPFDIGFDFPYYWYTVRHLYIGSNGYVAFNDNTLEAYEFQQIPSPERPNNLLAPLMTDLDCGVGGSVWYWGNADTFIVEYDSIRFWSTGGNNTFQIIISRPDSAITFQYKEQSGTPYQGWSPNMNQTGIDNITGNVGLCYLSGTYPSGNMYHIDLAVRFIPPESTSYQVHNCGIRNAMNDRSGGVFAINGMPMTFWAAVSNYGNQPESDFWTYVEVKRAGMPTLFTDSVLTSVPGPGDVDSVVFQNTWTPASNGIFVIVIYTRLAGDVFPPDDTTRVEMNVMTLPGTLTYDKGTNDGTVTWTGPGGYGCRFVPPVYPCSVSSIRFFAGGAAFVQCAFGLFDDNGPGGSPGDTLYMEDVSVGGQNWYSLALPTPAVIEDGAFFVGAMSAAAGAPAFGMDSTPPLSREGWEFGGVWAPSRHSEEVDMMFNATIAGQVGVGSELEPAPVSRPPRITANPNPFAARCRLSLSSPSQARAIEVYDATGQLAWTLPIVNGAAVLDGRLVPGGIYFARLPLVDSPVTKLVVCPD